MSFKPNKEQTVAIEQIREWIHNDSPMISLTGPGGVGKSSVLAIIKTLFPSTVLWTSTTGKAALRLRNLINIKATTLHAVLYEPPKVTNTALYFEKLKKKQSKYLVIDEASMITPKIYNDLQLWVAEGVKILFVGDAFQLPPVMTSKEEEELGNDFSVFREVHGPKLSKVMRSDDELTDVATILRTEHRLPDSGDKFLKINIRNPSIYAAKQYLEDPSDHALITWTNKSRMKTNSYIRDSFEIYDGLPQKDEPILIFKNSGDVLNGESLLVESIEKGGEFGPIQYYRLRTAEGINLKVYCDGKTMMMDGGFPSLTKDKWKHYMSDVRNSIQKVEPVPISYGYVSTAHKAQGSEYRRVTVFMHNYEVNNPYFKKDCPLPDGTPVRFSIRWLYTAITRARKQVTVVTG